MSIQGSPSQFLARGETEWSVRGTVHRVRHRFVLGGGHDERFDTRRDENAAERAYSLFWRLSASAPAEMVEAEIAELDAEVAR